MEVIVRRNHDREEKKMVGTSDNQLHETHKFLDIILHHSRYQYTRVLIAG